MEKNRQKEREKEGGERWRGRQRIRKRDRKNEIKRENKREEERKRHTERMRERGERQRERDRVLGLTVCGSKNRYECSERAHPRCHQTSQLISTTPKRKKNPYFYTVQTQNKAQKHVNTGSDGKSMCLCAFDYQGKYHDSAAKAKRRGTFTVQFVIEGDGFGSRAQRQKGLVQIWRRLRWF
ncbi:hypothetical protein WMY93_000647 [Mugilogobius chulae]|uniref:Uncharacterized protein n=1 Tax=Mugilogobius chulae TaxID=88201 RepID=A0AAW0PZW2_9GOBI